MKSLKTSTVQQTVSTLPCACANLRLAARAVSRLYNHALQPAGLEVTQYTLLTALDLKGETTQGELGSLLALDTTTLTRMLGLLLKRGWTAARPGNDRRQRLLRLTAAGRKKLSRSRPLWERAQEGFRRSLGDPAWNQLSGLLAEVTRVSQQP